MTFTEVDLEEYYKMAIAVAARLTGVWNFELNSLAELKGLVKAKNPQLLSAIDSYYQIQLKALSATQEELIALIPERDSALQTLQQLARNLRNAQ